MDINVIGKIPPHSIEAEQAALGCMLLDSDVIPTVTELIKSEDFYRPDHKEIFNAILDIVEKAEPVDIITVSEQLQIRGTLEKVGGLEYLTGISNGVPTIFNARHYSRIVEEKSLLRKLIKASAEILDMSYEAAEDAVYVLDAAEKSIFDIIQHRSTQGFTHIKDVLMETFERLERLYNSKSPITGIPTGFTDLDHKTAGLQNSDFILIAARPGMGKTAMALNIAQYAAVRENIPVAIFNMEMTKDQLVNRILSSEVMVNSHRMRTGKLNDEDWQLIAHALGPLSGAPIYIDDTAGLSVMDIRSKCRRLKLEKKLGLVVIDYLQLMQSRGRTENRQQEVAEISRSLKILARELDVPVVTMSQLSRRPEERGDHRPMLSDLRESGAIEQDADLVMFLYRDDYYKPESEQKNIAEVIIAKHRNGSIGTVKLRWFEEYTKFANLESHEKGKNF